MAADRKWSFQIQTGLTRTTVVIETKQANIDFVKNFACEFVDRKYPEYVFVDIQDRLMLFRHDQRSPHKLELVKDPADIKENCLIEIVLSEDVNVDDVQIRPHTLYVHSYRSPAFCDLCGEMLFGLVRQGLKCEGCGLDFHKRCAYKIPNNCSHSRYRRQSAATPPAPVMHLQPATHTVSNISKEPVNTNELYPMASLSPAEPFNPIAGRSQRSSSWSGRPLWMEKRFAHRVKVPHTFQVHSYTRPTICQYCRKLLVGIRKQGVQCRDCKFNTHKKCAGKVAKDCTGEVAGSNESLEDNEEEGPGLTPDTPEMESPPGNLDFNESDMADDTMVGGTATNIPLQRIVQSVRHTKRKDSCKKEGYLVHYTNKDPTRKKHFWSLDAKCITMFINANSKQYWKSISLSEIVHVESNPMSETCEYQFTFRLLNDIIYFVSPKHETSSTNIGGSNLIFENASAGRQWEVAIKQALLPVIPITPKPSVTPWDGKNVENLNNENGKSCEQIKDITQLYTIIADEVLGSGQFGTVFGGFCKLTNKSAAIKVIDKLRFPRKQETQLKNEVSILQAVTYPGVIMLEGMFENPEKIYVVMEKMAGDMLEMILNSEKGRLSERVTKFLISQILQALKYLHSIKVVHCDLKPENVLLSSDKSEFPQIKLCDFGFARIIGEKSFRRSVVGTPAYLAPEVLKSKGYNKSLDVWSVGVIIYVSLSGTFPFNEDEDITDQIQNAAFMYPEKPWKEISSEGIDLIGHMLLVDRGRRWLVDKCLTHPWLQNYETYCDLRRLETSVGQRYLTHESDDENWKKFTKQQQVIGNLV